MEYYFSIYLNLETKSNEINVFYNLLNVRCKNRLEIIKVKREILRIVIERMTTNEKLFNGDCFQ